MDALLNWLWQGGVVAAALALALLALDRARANVRYGVCWTALLFVLALPLLPALRLAFDSSRTLAAAPQKAIVSLPDAWWTSPMIVLGPALLWSAIHLFRLAGAVVAIRRARACSRAFPACVQAELPHWRRAREHGRRARLVVSDAVGSAAVLGWGTPMIAVAPGLVSKLDADELDRVLIHEWAHVQRRDDLVNVLQVAVRIVAGWHPALWWIDRRLHVEREMACDEMTVAMTGSPKSYAECLVKLAGLRSSVRSLHTAPAVLTASGLRARIVNIVSARPMFLPAWSRGLAVATVMALCLLSVGVGGLKLVGATAFALPFVSLPAANPTLDRFAAATLSTLPSIAAPAPGLDMASRSQSTPPSRVEAAPAQTQTPAASEALRGADPRQAPAAPSPADVAPAEAPAPVAAPVAGSTADEQASSHPTVPASPSRVVVESPQTPWAAAAAGGTAVGRVSKDAGVATAGLFTRFARRVAGSF